MRCCLPSMSKTPPEKVEFFFELIQLFTGIFKHDGLLTAKTLRRRSDLILTQFAELDRMQRSKSMLVL